MYRFLYFQDEDKHDGNDASPQEVAGGVTGMEGPASTDDSFI